MQLSGEDLALSHLGESMFARFNVALTLSAQFIVPSIFATTAVAGPEGVSITGPDPVSFSKFIKAHGQECQSVGVGASVGGASAGASAGVGAGSQRRGERRWRKRRRQCRRGRRWRRRIQPRPALAQAHPAVRAPEERLVAPVPEGRLQAEVPAQVLEQAAQALTPLKGIEGIRTRHCLFDQCRECG
jgi:hypothetical protein